MSESTSTGLQMPSSSTSSKQPTLNESYIEAFNKLAQVQKTVPQINAEGDIKIKLVVLWFVGGISTILALSGCIFSICYPSNSKDFWVIIGPIVSSLLSATIGYIFGQKKSSK
jgi:hypothetical protein